MENHCQSYGLVASLAGGASRGVPVCCDQISVTWLLPGVQPGNWFITVHCEELPQGFPQPPGRAVLAPSCPTGPGVSRTTAPKQHCAHAHLLPQGWVSSTGSFLGLGLVHICGSGERQEWFREPDWQEMERRAD